MCLKISQHVWSKSSMRDPPCNLECNYKGAHNVGHRDPCPLITKCGALLKRLERVLWQRETLRRREWSFSIINTTTPDWIKLLSCLAASIGVRTAPRQRSEMGRKVVRPTLGSSTLSTSAAAPQQQHLSSNPSNPSAAYQRQHPRSSRTLHCKWPRSHPGRGFRGISWQGGNGRTVSRESRRTVPLPEAYSCHPVW